MFDELVGRRPFSECANAFAHSEKPPLPYVKGEGVGVEGVAVLSAFQYPFPGLALHSFAGLQATRVAEVVAQFVATVLAVVETDRNLEAARN